MKPTTEIFTNCRREHGITVGIIDSIGVLCRLLKNRDISNRAVTEAIKDLHSDEDFKYLIKLEAALEQEEFHKAGLAKPKTTL